MRSMVFYGTSSIDPLMRLLPGHLLGQLVDERSPLAIEKTASIRSFGL